MILRNSSSLISPSPSRSASSIISCAGAARGLLSATGAAAPDTALGRGGAAGAGAVGALLQLLVRHVISGDLG